MSFIKASKSGKDLDISVCVPSMGCHKMVGTKKNEDIIFRNKGEKEENLKLSLDGVYFDSEGVVLEGEMKNPNKNKKLSDMMGLENIYTMSVNHKKCPREKEELLKCTNSYYLVSKDHSGKKATYSLHSKTVKSDKSNKIEHQHVMKKESNDVFTGEIEEMGIITCPQSNTTDCNIKLKNKGINMATSMVGLNSGMNQSFNIKEINKSRCGGCPLNRTDCLHSNYLASGISCTNCPLNLEHCPKNN